MNRKILFLLLLFVPGVSFAAISAYLEIEGVNGESQAENYKDQIDVLSWEWGSSTSGRSTCLEDVSITKNIDLSSPTLLMDQVQGTVYPTATLSVVSTNAEGSREFISIEFRNVFMTSISTGGSSGSEPLTEKATFIFEEALYKYTPEDSGGSGVSSVEATVYPGNRCN